MPDLRAERPEKSPEQSPEQRMLRDVGDRQRRMLRARREGKDWSAIAVIGTVGWSVTVPTLIGVAIGVWIERRFPGPIPWAITLLLAGLVVGCVSAWLRIREDR